MSEKETKKETAPAPAPVAPAPNVPIDDAFIKKVLLAGQYASEEDMVKAEHYAKAHHSPLTEYFFNEELLNKELLGHAIGEALGLRYVNLSQNPPEKMVMVNIPKAFAEEHRAI